MNGKTRIAIVFAVFVAVLSTANPDAGADPAFPADWSKWTSVSTPLTKIGALPDCKADVKTLPPIYQETVATYCNVRVGGPGKVRVLVNPAALETYKSRNGKFADGGNLVLHLQDMKVLFVTSHKGGAPAYAVFTEDGKNITATQGPLSAATCQTCHSGYSAFCVGGQCGKPAN
jgi:hypothetical protein